ncbi:uncharacterized protein LOC112048537 isoform X2 [Bicyclus anynana]|uniref:Uncharacterized protein LOC112048537 isoform X2 n=1 Tax=Bicyclus anynana TaxID=110368 RepID=A0A6J1NA41_BICAN|nr:uncharacterized protein LOC112048537 isoform X2 [Bicyclus anynana]
MSLDEVDTDEYTVTALQIFQYCGADAGSTLRVDSLMDQFAPFVRTNKAEYSYLKSLLDPEQTNPEITVSMLAASLNKYSESQKIKFDLEESFNNKSGLVPHDSDSGISTDGFQLLEELQCELREKSRLAQQLRTQLDYTDRHHEEALATVTAERDSLRAHLNMLRDENMTLAHVRRDYEDVCERLGGSEQALVEARRELEHTRRRARVLTEQVTLLETEKLNLQELLSKSKDECHRINDMYASRQSSLLEENETLRTEHADLSSRMRDQEEFMQQIIKEKVILEMEVKDMLNKSNHTHHHMEQSIDVSYTEDQMLTALDSLNADSRFPQESRLLDEESFVKALKEDQGRPTNMSLFDEIRLSFCNMSRNNMSDFNCTQPLENHVLDDFVTISTQTDDKLYYVNKNEMFKECSCHTATDSNTVNTATQTIGNNIRDTESSSTENNLNNILPVHKIDNNAKDRDILLKESHVNENNFKNKEIIMAMKINKDIKCNNILPLDTQINEFNSISNGKRNVILFESKINKTKTHSQQYLKKDTNGDIFRDTHKKYHLFLKNHKQIRSFSAPNVGIIKRGPPYLEFKDDNRKIDTKDQATNTSTQLFEVFKDIEVMNVGTQTEVYELVANNNNVEVCFDCTKCIECERLKMNVVKLENDISYGKLTITDMNAKLDQYEDNLDNLSKFVDEGNEKNNYLKAVADSLQAKLSLLQGACVKQGNKIERLLCDTCAAEVQTESEVTSVSTQAEEPCADCIKRNVPRRGIRRYLCLFTGSL